MSALVRCLFIAERLRCGVTFADLQTDTKVSTRTLRRDLATLRAAGIKIEYHRQHMTRREIAIFSGLGAIEDRRTSSHVRGAGKRMHPFTPAVESEVPK
jgi:DeoR/GlpR family transcriptional regulator of sugar metabolism